MALAYTDVLFELREISLKNRPKELYEVSKKGTVPVLVTSDNLVIDESLEIMLWSLKNNSKQKWLKDNYSEELDIININDTKFKKWLDRYKYYDRYPGKSKAYYRKECCNILDIYENKLSNSQYLLKNKISLVDIAVFPFIRQFANVDQDWFNSFYKKLPTWLHSISSSELFAKVMEKNELWVGKEI
jgi:glutathione S-transferase